MGSLLKSLQEITNFGIENMPCGFMGVISLTSFNFNTEPPFWKAPVDTCSEIHLSVNINIIFIQVL